MSEVNLAELEEKYGKELAERIKREVEICEQFGYKYEIWIERGWGAIDKIFFVTAHDTIIYEVAAEKRIFIDKHRFTRADCEKSLEAMERLWEREMNCSTHTSS